MSKKSTESYLLFLRYYLQGALYICNNYNGAIQIDLIELYVRTALNLLGEITQTGDEDPNDMTNEV